VIKFDGSYIFEPKKTSFVTNLVVSSQEFCHNCMQHKWDL